MKLNHRTDFTTHTNRLNKKCLPIVPFFSSLYVITPDRNATVLSTNFGASKTPTKQNTLLLSSWS
jgi:hypothetical protein